MERQPDDPSDFDPSRDLDRTETAGEALSGEKPRIYVASLADYNKGVLHGAWLDPNQEQAALEEAVQSVLDASPTDGAEEFAIFDYEGFGPWRLDEYESLDTASRVARGIAEHGPAFAHWIGVVESTDPDAIAGFEDAYLGHWESTEEYARSYVDDIVDLDKVVDLPGLLSNYVIIDYDAMARDFELSGDIMTSEGDGGVYVFCGNW